MLTLEMKTFQMVPIANYPLIRLVAALIIPK